MLPRWLSRSAVRFLSEKAQVKTFAHCCLMATGRELATPSFQSSSSPFLCCNMSPNRFYGLVSSAFVVAVLAFPGIGGCIRVNGLTDLSQSVDIFGTQPADGAESAQDRAALDSYSKLSPLPSGSG